MRFTIIYDNRSLKKGVKADWGFSCLLEAYGKIILFDTGASGAILLDNMKKLDIDCTTIDEIFISHEHWDHTGGLADFLKFNPVTVYIPSSYRKIFVADTAIEVKESREIHENIFSTGELENIEQSLVVRIERGLVVIVGCSHPGVDVILDAATQFGKPYAILGGLHGFREFEFIKDLQLICPCHCTKHISEIKSLYPDRYVQGGAGTIIEL